LYFVIAKKNKNPFKNSLMSKILTKKVQTQLNDYFSFYPQMTKPETRCLKDMVLGILKSKTVFVNQIAASLREPLKLKDVCKRLSSQYLKEEYAEKVRQNHLSSVKSCVSKDDFILMDGTDISKKHAKYMEGLEFVKNGDTGGVGLGYNVLNINSISNDKEITPLYSKAYSYQMGALSSNNEIKKAVRELKEHITDKGCWVFDRGADNGILKDFFISESSQTIIRLKKNTKVLHKQSEHQVSQLIKKIEFSLTQKVIKIKKDKPVIALYELGAIPITYNVKGVSYPMWLVVSRNKKHGGLCYLLVKSKLLTAIEVAKWAFKGYGLRWKIEDIQIKTFKGLQSMLATLTVAMFIIYKKIKAIHFNLLLDAGYNYLNKHTLRELTNFIYYKISKVVSILLMPTKNRWKVAKTVTLDTSGQLNLGFG
jgi:hypothetical protein